MDTANQQERVDRFEQTRQQVRNIDPLDLWYIFLRRLWLMILAAGVVVGALFTYDKVTYVPMYRCTATLYVLKDKSEDSSDNSTYSSLSLGKSVIKDCTYFLKCHEVLDRVIEELQLNMSYSQLYSSVSTANPEDTHVLEVTAAANSPELAKQIVDTVCEIGNDKITESLGFQQTNFCEYGVYNDTPYNRVGAKRYVIAGIAAAALVYGIFFLIFFLDNDIRTNEELEKYLGLSILGEVPNFSDSKEGYKGYKKGYYSRGYYKSSKTTSAAKPPEKAADAVPLVSGDVKAGEGEKK